MRACIIVMIFSLFVTVSQAQLLVSTTQGEEANLAAPYSNTDLIQGLIPAVLSGDRGWHPANQDPLDQLPAFTDGTGIRFTGLTGLLNDFPGAGNPTKLIEYDLGGVFRIDEIRIFSGNNGRDGRVFHTYTVFISRDNGQTFDFVAYVQSHPSGTLNNSQFNQWRVVLTQLYNPLDTIARGVTHIRFHFYSVDNTGGQMRDPFDGTNPFTGTNDGLTAAFVSPLIWEIDVIGVEMVPGDVNSDGCVDDSDLLAVLFSFGIACQNCAEDLNGDGVVDDSDLLLVLFNFGAGC
jgi:hypothetical protein